MRSFSRFSRRRYIPAVMLLDARIAPSGTGPVDSPTPTQPVVEHAPPVPGPVIPGIVDTGTSVAGGAASLPAPSDPVVVYAPQPTDAPPDPHMDSTLNTGWMRSPSGFLLPPAQFPGP